MSRKIDMENLSQDDKVYLAQRGLLSTDIASVEEQRSWLDPEANARTLDQIANTGDVNVANLTTEELEAELERRRAEAKAGQQPKLEPVGAKQATVEEDPAEESYNDWNKAQLIAELQARNENRPEDEQFPIGGNKGELVALLEGDDAEQE